MSGIQSYEYLLFLLGLILCWKVEVILPCTVFSPEYTVLSDYFVIVNHEIK